MPVEADVDSDATELLVDERPVDSELTPLCAVLMPVDVEVDSDATELLVELMPVDVEVDSDATELLVDDRPVDNDDIDVVAESSFDATAYSWLPLIASVLAAVT
ncbi:hypothetical protein WJ63_03525 [Burkholderia pyrrocinia]|nr:hypothetical protein WJ63_03525 [Burkholderia pyrrocinia]